MTLTSIFYNLDHRQSIARIRDCIHHNCRHAGAVVDISGTRRRISAAGPGVERMFGQLGPLGVEDVVF